MPETENPPDPDLSPDLRRHGLLSVVWLLGGVTMVALAVIDRTQSRGAVAVPMLQVAAVIVGILALGYLGSILAGGNEGGAGFKAIADDAVSLEKEAADAARSVAPKPPEAAQ